MPYYEWSYLWTASTAATTGALAAVEVSGKPSMVSFYFTTGRDCTATVQMQTAAESSLAFVAIGSSAANLNSTAGAAELHQFAGPLAWVRPYITAKTTGVLTVHGFAE